MAQRAPNPCQGRPGNPQHAILSRMQVFHAGKPADRSEWRRNTDCAQLNTAGSTWIHVCRAAPTTRPSASYSVLAVNDLRPSVPRCRPTTTCASPTTGSASTRAAIRPRTHGRPSRSSDQPPTQSRAAHVVATPQRCTPSTRSVDSAWPGCGTHSDATNPGSVPIGPGKIRSPSPSSRSGPQAKQEGNGWARRPGYRSIASAATFGGTASTASTACDDGTASATRLSCSDSTVTPPTEEAAGGPASGGGRRRLPSPAPPSVAAPAPPNARAVNPP